MASKLTRTDSHASASQPPPYSAAAQGKKTTDLKADIPPALQPPERNLFGPIWHKKIETQFDHDITQREYQKAAERLIDATYRSALPTEKLQGLWEILSTYTSPALLTNVQTALELGYACWQANLPELQASIITFAEKTALGAPGLHEHVALWRTGLNWASAPRNALFETQLGHAAAQHLRSCDIGIEAEFGQRAIALEARRLALDTKKSALDTQESSLKQKEKELGSAEIREQALTLRTTQMTQRETAATLKEDQATKRQAIAAEATQKLQTAAREAALAAEQSFTASLAAYEQLCAVRKKSVPTSCDTPYVELHNIVDATSLRIPYALWKQREPTATAETGINTQYKLGCHWGHPEEKTIQTWIIEGIVDAKPENYSNLILFCKDKNFNKLSKRLEGLQQLKNDNIASKGSDMILVKMPKNWWQLAMQYLLTDGEASPDDLKHGPRINSPNDEYVPIGLLRAITDPASHPQSKDHITIKWQYPGTAQTELTLVRKTLDIAMGIATTLTLPTGWSIPMLIERAAHAKARQTAEAAEKSQDNLRKLLKQEAATP